MSLEKQAVDEFAFIGEEFLVWLWWSAETRGGLYAVGEDERIGIALDRVLEFRDEATGVRVVVRGDAPTRAPEAREALARGMRLERAGLIITVAEENVVVTLDGSSFDLRSVKGERPEGESYEERDAAALATLFGLTDALDRVYRLYLQERTATTFGSEAGPEMLAWMRTATDARKARLERSSEDRESIQAGIDGE